jgi:uncharacterized alkaline shock family protein YloU
MPSKIKNEYGFITISNEVIARVAGMAAMECYGIVGMAAKNVKDGFVQLLKKESLTKGIRLTINELSLIIDLHIIVEYGTNISAIGDTLVSTVKYRVEEYVGLPVERINIYVEGVRVDA